jgi:adenylate cyclase
VAFRLFRFRHFSRQVLLLLAGLIALVQVAVYLLVTRANESNARKHIEQSLQAGARIFQLTIDDRVASLASSAKLMSNDYATRQLLMKDPIDRVTLKSNLNSYLKRVNVPVITIFSPEGETLALTDYLLGAENVGPFRYLIRKATEGEMEQASDFAYLDGKLHVLVVVPLFAPYPNIAAWFGLAFPIDADFARSLKDITQLDVTFSSAGEGTKPQVLATTLTPGLAGMIAGYRSTATEPIQGIQTARLGGEPYVTLFQPLPLLGDDPARIALQRSLIVELAPARDLERTVLSISLAALAAATLAAIWIARGVSQPVQQLAAHTKLVAAGDYTRRINLPREDELGQLATAFNHMTAGLAERDRVRDLLGKVVSPEIAAQLLRSDLKLGGEERVVTILFCDLRDFTTLSERLAPTDVLALLNRYLDRMSLIIEQHGGVIDKYIGDAIMALFGAPVAAANAPERAIAAARDMARALDLLNRELAAEGKPALVFGIGINTARVVAGNMGSKTRLNYTVIGDGVNLASRLEGLTKDPAYGTPIIVSEATLAAMQERPPARELGEVKVKGKTEAVKIFALSAKGESAPPYAV